jgi:hypothetical protein
MLGQDVWRGTGGHDAVLGAAIKHLAIPESHAPTWRAVLAAMPLPEGFYRWLAERHSRLVPPAWASQLVNLPWSAVFTSSLDPTIGGLLRSSSRQPQVVLTNEEAPPASRSVARTPIYYLFGRAGGSDAAASPPLTQSQLRIRRTAHSIPLLNRLIDAATALGLVVVDGYRPGSDWLDLDSLLATIERAPAGRVLWFGWCATDQSLPSELRQLAQDGRILTDEARLGTRLAELDASGRLAISGASRLSEPGHVSYRDGRVTVVPPDLRIQVEAASYVVDDTWSAFLEPLGKDATYGAFVRFHGDVDGPRAMVEGVRRQFAFTRDFEAQLRTLVGEGIEGHSRLRDPIVVHGQSATGKSVALARLVSVVRGEMNAAVLYAAARVPQASDVADFCEHAERTGASATVIVCDANAPISRYRDLLMGLRSRGRKVVVVGSTYRSVDNASRLPREFIEAPSVLSERERAALRSLVATFAGVETFREVGADRSVLGALYRALPSSRYRLSAGLGSEARSAEQALRERAGNESKSQPTLMAQKLTALGLSTSDTAAFEQSLVDAVAAADDSAGRLVDLVMAAGHLNCAVPINLLMRAVSGDNKPIDIDRLAQLFRGLDLFRWQQLDARGEELLVSPRLTLEAEILCRRRLMSSDAEAKRLLALISAARSTWDFAGSERRFLIDLVQKLGPDGPLKTRYKTNYVEVARALTALRIEAGVEDPRLALQESVLRRSAIREGVAIEEAPTDLLEEARDAVQSAIDSISRLPGRGNARTRANLVVERATIYGFLAVHEAKKHSGPEKVWSSYRAARAAAQAAIGTTDAYNPFDVALWTPADLLREGSLDGPKQLELHADIQSILDRVDPAALPVDQRERFYSRLYSLGGLLEMPELSEQALDALDREGSAAGLFLRARRIGPTYRRDDASPPDRDRAAKASELLRANWSLASTDERCLRYSISCEWISATGQWPLRGERGAIPHTPEARLSVLRSLQALRDLGVFERDHGYVYLEAVLLWLGADESHAIRMWRDLSRETEYSDSRRVIRRLVLTDDTGRPRVFEGRVESETEPGRFSVSVEALGRRVYALSRDFPSLDLTYGRTIPRLGIAFNYIGPLAEPLQFAGGRQ